MYIPKYIFITSLLLGTVNGKQLKTKNKSKSAPGPPAESGESFTEVIDDSHNKPRELRGRKSTTETASTCGHKQVTFLEAPGFIKYHRFSDEADYPEALLAKAGDFNVYQDNFYTFDDISDENHADFFRVGKLKELAGEHRGVDFNVQDEVAPGPAAGGGYGPNIAMADIGIDHPDYGTGTIKVNGYHTTFGEGELAIIGGTGDFVGAVGTVRPYYGLILMDDETLARTEEVLNPNLSPQNSNVEPDTPLSFGFYLEIDFTCKA